jgi:hypothetical protein
MSKHRKRTRTERIRRESSRTALKREATFTEPRTAVRAQLRAELAARTA